MKKYFFTLLAAIFLAGPGLLAQILPTSTMMSLEGYVNRSGKYLMQIGDDTEVVGSPYLTDTFSTGYLHIEGDWYKGADLRYDAYNAVFEVKLSNGIFEISPNDLEADSIIYNDEIFVPKDILSGNMMRLQYIALLFSADNYELFKKYRIRMNNAVPTDGYSEAKPAEFRPNPPEYLIFKGQDITEVKGVRSLADAFGVHRKEIKQYLKKTKFNLNDEQDLIKVVQYFAFETQQ